MTIQPLHPMCELRGAYDELRVKASAVENGAYVKIVLTDRPMTPEISAYFQALFDSRGSILMERLSECSCVLKNQSQIEQRPPSPLFREQLNWRMA